MQALASLHKFSSRDQRLLVQPSRSPKKFETSANKLVGKKYEKIAAKINEYLDFMDAVGVNTSTVIDLNTVEFFTSHEGLHLPYEAALTRVDSLTNEVYCTSAHFIWIGDRTRFIDSAHVEFCRGISNPIGIKCGPSLDPDELVKIIETINPTNEASFVGFIVSIILTNSSGSRLGPHLIPIGLLIPLQNST